MSARGPIVSKALIGPASPTRISFDEKTIEDALRRAERDSDRRRSWRNRELLIEERKKIKSTIEEESENDDDTKNDIDIARIRANAMAALEGRTEGRNEGRSTPTPQRSHRRHRSYQGERSYFTAQDEDYSRPMTATVEMYSRPKTAIIDTSLRRPDFTPGKRTHSKTSIDNNAFTPSASRRRTNSIPRGTDHLSKIQFSSTPPFFPEIPHPLHSNPVFMIPDSSSSEEEEEPEMEEHVVMAWNGNTLIEKKVMSPKNGPQYRRPSSMSPNMSGGFSPMSPLSPLTPITPFSPSPSSRPRPRPKSAICTSTSRTTIMRDPSPPMPPLTKTSTSNSRLRSNTSNHESLERRLSRSNTGEERRLSRTTTGEERRRSRTDDIEKLRTSAKHVLLNPPKMPSKKTSLTSFRDPDILEKELRRKSGIRGLGWLNWS